MLTVSFPAVELGFCDLQRSFPRKKPMDNAKLPSPSLPVVVFWDFDWSMIDENTDTWIIEQLASDPSILSEIKDTAKFPVWTDRVTEALRRLHEQGVRKQQLLDKMKTIPFHPGMKAAVKLLHDAGAYQIILSDSNSEFIKCIIDENSLYKYIDEIITNPAFFNEDERLIARTHQPAGNPHGCSYCPPQLCKGKQLSKAMQRIVPAGSSQVLYIGDGAGDFCPCLRLQANDVILARKSFPLFAKLMEAGSQVRAKVVPWNNGNEALEQIRMIIQGKK